ncbi:uncharacterized protein LOC112686918 isoform X2 [Sipha flava]|uniref:[histone H3]-lysine(36) N-trimethyltransferase n=1 Tax=Sipha flava TaxID=143950 RepID=A0A8B8FWH6_9HEMI|nr:uncharacterized protein LOC112686918 isoform X2 [Sipha flava]
MSSSSSPMDYQKPVKVKSRWTQSCQMEMMMEESQSSLDMSDTITDVSTSDFNDIINCEPELNVIELRRSCRTSGNKTDYRQLNGLKTVKKKKCMTFKAAKKRGRKKEQLLSTTENYKEDKAQKSNSIIQHSIDWNNIKNIQSKKYSKSADNINEIIENCPSKPKIRRASLSWKFKYTNEVESKICILEKCINYNLSNEIMHLNLKDTLLKKSYLSTDNQQLNKNNKLDNEENKTNKNTGKNISTITYTDVDLVNSKHFEKCDEESNITVINKISSVNLEEQKQLDKLNKYMNQSDENKTFQSNNLLVPKPLSSNLDHVRYNPRNKFRSIRSKSLDNFQIKTNSIFKRSKSFDDMNILKYSVFDHLKLKKRQTKSPKKNRRQSKRIKPKSKNMEILDDMKVPQVNYDQVADEMYKEYQNQLLEARINDKEFDQKLKNTNFTLVNENIYRPNRQALKLYPPSEISALRTLKQRVISGDINDYCECTLSKEDILEGITGCDDRCLNRLLKVECGSGCSLKRYCTNKQFQNKQFKKTKIIKTENKGYGICAVEDIPKGVLINEYVGEVIDYKEMCNRLRKKEYANLNYLVQLNSDEIIDSTSKGNLTRFINHSCDPNSVGEKWHVLGQSRIGFFSTRYIKKGEEITFDYSFQIFGDGAQVCYCGSSKCRGFISKATPITSLSNSEDSEDATEDSASGENQKKKRILNKRTVYNNENKLRELGRQLTEIAKLKTGLKADQEMATLNLNRLMVHITDSVSRLHVLTFIREHDMNKRLFMDFSGLSIIHNWMTSNENESFKLMILEILAELPITNRNTITKSKVIDVVAEWADISQDVRTKIERLDYPVIELHKHIQEIDNLLPTNNNSETINVLVEKSRALWKKWIVLKMIFKIPKKTDQHKPIEEINLNKNNIDSCSYMDISVIDRKTFQVSNKYSNKLRNQQTVSFERMKLRKEYEQKIEQNRKNVFRKQVMYDWFENLEGVMTKKPEQHFLSHQKTLNPKSQNSTVNMQIPCLNSMPPQQPLVQFPQLDSYSQLRVIPKYHLGNQQTFFNTPSSLPNNPYKLPLKSAILPNSTPDHQDLKKPDSSPKTCLLKSAESNVFNLINESLLKHYNYNKNLKMNTEIEHSKNLCPRAVQSGIDLLARIKIISNSFKNQPSKLIKIKTLKQKNDKTKLKNIPISETRLQTVCNKNRRITFINEQTGVTSNTLSEDLMPTPKTIPLSGKNKFAKAIFTSLLKKSKLEKENLVPRKFVSTNLTNSEVITCNETDKEIELYKNMRPKIIKKVVSHVKVKNGVVPVIKRQWGFKLKGLKGNHDKIPATKRNIMRKGSIHKLALKNGVAITTKSALKRRNGINVDGHLRKPKEKRVTFMIEGETSPISPKSEVRPINLNQNTIKQKPFMKCHPFEIRNEAKSILQPSTSTVQASRHKHTCNKKKSTELKKLLSQRKHMIPKSMMSLSIDVLKLIPDNGKEVKKVVDYYHSMATVIVKTLGSYAKTTCQQARIRNNEDFKFLAKKLNSNVLLKELQCKRPDKLKINNITKEKVSEYIKKYMSRYGEVYPIIH